MKRVYVAGAYSDDNILGVLKNMQKGMRTGTEVALCGFAPFVPWLDYQFQLMLRPEENENLTMDFYYNYSLAFLEVCDYVLVVPGFENSKGTLGEITKAKQLNIPVYYSIDDLVLADSNLEKTNV